MLIGILSTFARMIVQLCIPSGNQVVLPPSVFVTNGTMPIAFLIYGSLAYSLIAAMFLIVSKKMTGNRISQGLKFGFANILIWTVYLLEPLPHGSPIDRITYPLADGFAFLIMGCLLGLLLGKKESTAAEKRPISVIPLFSISIFFMIGRLLQYHVFDIYSSFEEKRGETLLWCALTGLVIACVLSWFSSYVPRKRRFANTLLVGGILFGLNLLLFNGFMPLVFEADLLDLLVRTGLDIVSVTIGCLFFKVEKG